MVFSLYAISAATVIGLSVEPSHFSSWLPLLAENNTVINCLKNNATSFPFFPFCNGNSMLSLISCRCTLCWGTLNAASLMPCGNSDGGLDGDTVLTTVLSWVCPSVFLSSLRFSFLSTVGSLMASVVSVFSAPFSLPPLPLPLPLPVIFAVNFPPHCVVNIRCLHVEFGSQIRI